MYLPNIRVKDGEYTKTVYSMIKEQKYPEAIQVLSQIYEANSTSRAALSLLAYCNYYIQNYGEAAALYEQLSLLYPEVEEYKLYHAQALYNACCYEDAMKITSQIDNPKFQGKVTKLQAAIKYCEDDLPGAKSLVDQCPSDDPDVEVNQGCLLYKEGRFEEALRKYATAMQVSGYSPGLSYNIALCYYRLKQFAPALKHIADIIERGIREHPELSVGMTTEGIEVRSVGNTITLHETALIEAFNLKAAIEYQLKNYAAAREALTDMPPRSEEELDPVTLHNQGLMNMETKPTEGFEKLQFLLHQESYPQETFGNLLMLYCKYGYYDLAADVLAENAHLTYRYLTPYLYDFLDSLITQQTSPEEAYRKFDDIASKHTESLRKLTKQVQEARQNRDDDGVKKAVNDYEEALDRYIPVLMAQAKIYWDLENYQQVEKIFRKSVEFCNEHDVWKLNVAHVLFMQENKFKEATGFYEPIVKKNYENILNVSAIVLANLCVSYIMTSQNEEAEELMRKIEKEEEQVAYEDPDKKIYHLCIVNLVIGTLYCSKGNYEFGISRVIKSLEPYNKKLGTDTWFFAKRCFLSLIENLAKHMITVRDSVVQDCIQFLEHCEAYGRNVKALIEQPLEQAPAHPGKNTVTYEARLLKALLLEFMIEKSSVKDEKTSKSPSDQPTQFSSSSPDLTTDRSKLSSETATKTTASEPVLTLAKKSTEGQVRTKTAKSVRFSEEAPVYYSDEVISAVPRASSSTEGSDEENELKEAIRLWQLAVRNYMAFSDYSQLYESLKNLDTVEKWKTEDQQSKEELAKSFCCFLDFCLILLTKHRLLFPCGKPQTHQELQAILKALQFLDNMSVFNDLCPECNDIVSSRLPSSLKEGLQNVCEEILVLFKFIPNVEANNLLSVIQILELIKCDLKTNATCYHNLVAEIIPDLDYFEIIYTVYDEMIFTQFRSVIEYWCRQCQLMTSCRWRALEVAVNLLNVYMELKEFNHLKSQLKEESQALLLSTRFFEWFSVAVRVWLRIIYESSQARIHMALRQDQVKEDFSCLKFSCSAVDVVSCLEEVINCWNQWARPDSQGFADNFMNILNSLKQGIVHYVNELGIYDINQSGSVLAGRQKCFVLFNNLEYIRTAVNSFPLELKLEQFFCFNQTPETTNGSSRCDILRIFQFLHCIIAKKIFAVIQEMEEQIRWIMKKKIFQLVWASEDLKADQVVKPLLQYLDDLLVNLNNSLLRVNFDRMLLRVWQIFVEELYCHALNSIGNARTMKILRCYDSYLWLLQDKHSIFQQRISDALDLFLPYFHANGRGLSESLLRNQTYQEVVKILNLQKLTSEELIIRFLKEKLEEQERINESGLGALTLRVYRKRNRVCVDLIQLLCADTEKETICAMDTFITLELVPATAFPESPLKRTKLFKWFRCSKLQESFIFPVRPCQCQCENAALALTVVKNGQPSHEAYISLHHLPGTINETTSPTHEDLEEIELNLLKYNITENLTFRILEKRYWDSSAHKFICKRKLTLPKD